MPVLKPDQINPPPRAPFGRRAVAVLAVYAGIFGPAWALGLYETDGVTLALLNAGCLLAAVVVLGAICAHLDRQHAERMNPNGGRHG